jgi:hypothetical protein
MDPEPRVVHPTECYEDSTLWATPGGEQMHKITTILLSWRLFMVEPSHYSGSDIDQLDHRAKHARPRPIGFLLQKDYESRSRPKDKGYLRRFREGDARPQGSLYLERHSVPSLSTDREEISSQESAHPSNQICSRPREEVRRGPTHELSEVLGEPVRNGQQGSARPRI